MVCARGEGKQHMPEIFDWGCTAVTDCFLLFSPIFFLGLLFLPAYRCSAVKRSTVIKRWTRRGKEESKRKKTNHHPPMETTYIHVNICGSVLRTLGRVVKGADSRKKARQTKKIHHGSGRTGSVRLVFTWSVSGLGESVSRGSRGLNVYTPKSCFLWFPPASPAFWRFFE
jgi:hypothetical protein